MLSQTEEQLLLSIFNPLTSGLVEDKPRPVLELRRANGYIGIINTILYLQSPCRKLCDHFRAPVRHPEGIV